MSFLRWVPYVFRGIIRQPVRVGLALLAVTVAVFLYAVVASFDRGFRQMMTLASRPDVLVVFDRYQSCPPLSKLPMAHMGSIGELPGIKSVSAELFVLSSCSRATDWVAVYGIEPDKLRELRNIGIPDEIYQRFSEEKGLALVGSKAAARYGWQTGQGVSLERLGGLGFTIGGIFSSPGDGLENAILVDLEYLQQATGQPATATLMYVRLNDPEDAAAVAGEIDRILGSTSAPTKTTLQRGFLQTAMSGLESLVRFASGLGSMTLGLILVGVGNSLSIAIRDRTREIAILKTLGFRRNQILQVVLSEAVLASLLGGVIGATAAALWIHGADLSLASEGFSFSPQFSAGLFLESVALAALLGYLAGYWPAIRAARLPVGRALREVD
jgi:putative ABC transport system permease protein